MKSRMKLGCGVLLLLICQVWTGPQVHAQSHEGITVHGHWAIDIRQPNGTLVTHREFENGLTGAITLSKILTRAETPGPWVIGVINEGNPCVVNGASHCEIWDTNAALTPSVGVVRTLTSYTAYGTGVITLTGSIKALSTGTISTVTTMIATCSPTTTPFACRVGVPSNFTQAILATPLSVAANQTIEFTVTISFS